METNQNHKLNTAVDAGSERSEIPAATAASPPRPKRRTFQRDYKLRILREIDDANEPGATGLILRREGLYSAYLTEWRRWRAGLRDAELDPQLPPKAPRPPRGAARAEHDRLLRENERLKKKVRSQELLLELQKKLQEAMQSLDSEGSER